MVEGSGSRSSLLWEVRRLLDECEELPQILVMENVPQVHNKKNMPDFQKWLDFLSSKGYKTYWKDLNAKDYGVAQNRNRCFAVSLFGDYSFEFPNPIPLNKVMADYLEEEVDDKFYLKTEKAQKLIDSLISSGKLYG
jgi:DNA (cytosine-5)-methyltransferase 1